MLIRRDSLWTVALHLRDQKIRARCVSVSILGFVFVFV